MNLQKFDSANIRLIEIDRIICQQQLICSDNGLMHGNTGLSIYFYYLARVTGKSIYERLADDLLDKVLASLNSRSPCDFENGLAGIGLGIEFLVQNGFVEGDTDEVLEEIDGRLFKALHRDDSMSFEVTNGLTGCLFYLIFRARKPKNPLSSEQTINRQLIIMVINKLDILVPTQFSKIVEGTHFDLFWRFSGVLYSLYELLKLDIYAEKIKCMLRQWLPYIEAYIPSVQANRLHLATALYLVNTFVLSKRLERQIQILLFAIDFETLKTEFSPKQRGIHYGWHGVVLLLKRASLIIPETYPNYKRIDFTRKEISARYKSVWWDDPGDVNLSSVKQLGLSEGLTGVSLIELLYPGVFEND